MGNCNINKHVYNLKNDYQKNTPSRVLRHYHSQFFLSDETEDQVDTLTKLILMLIYKHTPPVKTKFSRQPAPWMKDTKINNLQHEKDHWQHEADKNPTDKNWKTYSMKRNVIKTVIKEVLQKHNILKY